MSMQWNRPPGAPLATLILAHGAGAGMDHPVLEFLAQSLAVQGFAVARFNFDYMQKSLDLGRRSPPSKQAVLLAQWRSVYQSVRQQVAGPVVLAGKSMGGRMATLLADELAPSAQVLYGYPFHPVGKPERLRSEHLRQLRTPTLIVQGERDALGSREQVQGYVLSPAIELAWLKSAGHDLKPLKSSGFSHCEYLESAAQLTAEFVRKALSKQG